MPIINRSSIAFKIVSLLLIVLIFGIIGKVFLENWHKIPFKDLTFNYKILSVAFLFSILNPAISALLWQYIFRLIGEKPSFISCWRINTYSQIVRYIPGKVWQYMGKIYWGKKIGISEKKIILSTLLETIFLLSGAFIISLFSIKHLISNQFISKGFFYLVGVIILGTILFLHPRFLEKVINTLGKKWIVNPVHLQFSFGHIIFIVSLFTLQWISIGTQFYLFILSFYKITINQFFYFISSNAASWLIGFLSIVPGGIVVKEGVFAFLFKRIVPVSFAIMCAILIRLFTLLTEVLITVVFFLLDRGAWQNLLEFRKSSPELRTESDDEKTD